MNHHIADDMTEINTMLYGILKEQAEHEITINEYRHTAAAVHDHLMIILMMTWHVSPASPQQRTRS